MANSWCNLSGLERPLKGLTQGSLGKVPIQPTYKRLWGQLGSPGGSLVKNPPAIAGDVGFIPGSGNSLEKEMAIHSSILAWEIPRTEEPDRLQSRGLQRVRHH